jgi:two-component system chemotaxis response regulator CheB
MPTRDIVVVGASAGGISTLKELVRLLPADFPAALCIVLHMNRSTESLLPQILARSGPLPVSFADDQGEIRTGHIYVAPPDLHLLVESDRMRLVRGPRENRHRPAIDVLFRSAAWAFGPRVVGVVLTGFLDDGAAGLWAIKTCGGVTVVQDPADALHHDMPANAARAIDVDYSLPVAQIGPLLVRLAGERIDGVPQQARPSSINTEIGFAKMAGDMNDMDSLGTLSAFTCPTCHGALWELHGDVLRYRCHTGHAFTRDSLVEEQTADVENALYSAMRAVEEKAHVLRRLGERHSGRSDALSRDFENKAAALDQTADVLRSMLSGESV